MKIDGFHHIGTGVVNMEESLAFYEKLGGRVVHHFTGKSGDEIYLVDLGGGVVLELLPRNYTEDEAFPRFAHIALAVEDVFAAEAEALAAGAKSQQPAHHTKLGTMLADNAFVYGPGGEVIEFFHVRGYEE